MLSSVNDEDKESPLEVAARWNHQSVVRYLLQNVAWNEEEVKKAVEIEDLNPEIMRMLKEYSKRRFNCFFNFCLCK
jgi:ankyrin repeat protein